MPGTDNPPSTTSSSRTLRRAVVTAFAIAIAVMTVIGASVAGGGEAPLIAAAPPPPATRAVEDLARVEALAQAASAGGPTTTAPTTTVPATTVPPTTSSTAAPPAEVAPATSGTGWSDPGNPAAWDRLASCESSGNWAADTGNGYYGGLQFSLASWHAAGGTGYPHQSSRDTQIAVAQRLWRQGGWQHWPGCSRQLGYI